MRLKPVYGIKTMREAKDQLGILGILACLLCTPFLMTNCFVGTGLALMYVEFSDIPSEVVALVITIPSLCSVIFSVVGGQLAQKYPIRNIFCIAAVINIIGGLIPVFLNNIYLILASRVIYGIGFGLAFSLGASLLSIVFDGELKQKMLGLNSAVGMAVCFVFIWISVWLLDNWSWRGTFLGYLVLIPFLILDFFCMPKNVTPNELGLNKKESIQNSTAQTGKKAGISPLFVLFLLCVGIYNIAGMASGTNLGVYMLNDGLSTSAGYGLASNLSMIGQLVFGLLYPYIQKGLKQYTVPVSMLVGGLGYILLTNAMTTTAFCIANFVAFMGAGVFNPGSVYVNNQLSRPEERGRMMGVYYSVTGVGQFITSFALSFLAMAFGVTSHRAPFICAAGIMLTLGVLYLIVVTLVTARRKARGEPSAD